MYFRKRKLSRSVAALISILRLAASAAAECSGKTAAYKMEQTFAQSADMDCVDDIDHECLHEHLSARWNAA